MAMSAEHRSKFAALHRQWWRLHMSEKFSSGTINFKQTDKQIFCKWLVAAFERFESHLPKDTLCKIMLKFVHGFGENGWNLSLYFQNVALVSP